MLSLRHLRIFATKSSTWRKVGSTQTSWLRRQASTCLSKLNFTPGQRYHHALHQHLEWLPARQPHAVPEPSRRTIRQLRISPSCSRWIQELAFLSPSEWMEFASDGAPNGGKKPNTQQRKAQSQWPSLASHISWQQFWPIQLHFPCWPSRHGSLVSYVLVVLRV